MILSNIEGVGISTPLTSEMDPQRAKYDKNGHLNSSSAALNGIKDADVSLEGIRRTLVHSSIDSTFGLTSGAVVELSSSGSTDTYVAFCVFLKILQELYANEKKSCRASVFMNSGFGGTQPSARVSSGDMSKLTEDLNVLSNRMAEFKEGRHNFFVFILII
jgi:hypothetical protein